VEQQGNLPIIYTISGGFGGGGESNSARKAYARKLDDFEVYSVQKPPKSRKYNPLIIGFRMMITLESHFRTQTPLWLP
jgi:hypothetical protein